MFDIMKHSKGITDDQNHRNQKLIYRMEVIMVLKHGRWVEKKGLGAEMGVRTIVEGNRYLNKECGVAMLFAETLQLKLL